MTDKTREEEFEKFVKQADIDEQWIAYNYLAKSDGMIVDLMFWHCQIDKTLEEARKCQHVDMPDPYRDFEKDIEQVCFEYKQMIARELAMRICDIIPQSWQD